MTSPRRAEHRKAASQAGLRYVTDGVRGITRQRLERRLAELQPRLERSSDAEDLRAINLQRVEAFYRCE